MRWTWIAQNAIKCHKWKFNLPLGEGWFTKTYVAKTWGWLTVSFTTTEPSTTKVKRVESTDWVISMPWHCVLSTWGSLPKALVDLRCLSETGGLDGPGLIQRTQWLSVDLTRWMDVDGSFDDQKMIKRWLEQLHHTITLTKSERSDCGYPYYPVTVHLKSGASQQLTTIVAVARRKLWWPAGLVLEDVGRPRVKADRSPSLTRRPPLPDSQPQRRWPWWPGGRSHLPASSP